MPILPFLMLLLIAGLCAGNLCFLLFYNWERYKLIRSRSITERALPFLVISSLMALTFLMVIAFHFSLPRL